MNFSYYCPFCLNNANLGACVHVKRIEYDAQANIRSVEFREMSEIYKLPGSLWYINLNQEDSGLPLLMHVDDGKVMGDG